MRTKVDLPQPDGPTTQRNSRRWVTRSMSFKATVTPPSALRKVFVSFSTRRATSRLFSFSNRARTGSH